MVVVSQLAGLILLPGAINNAFLSPVTGKMFDHFGAKPLFIIGLLLIAASMYMVIDLTATTSITYIVIVTIYSMQLALDSSNVGESFAAAASDTYVYMLIVAVTALLFVLFIPSKREKEHA